MTLSLASVLRDCHVEGSNDGVTDDTIRALNDSLSALHAICTESGVDSGREIQCLDDTTSLECLAEEGPRMIKRLNNLLSGSRPLPDRACATDITKLLYFSFRLQTVAEEYQKQDHGPALAKCAKQFYKGVEVLWNMSSIYEAGLKVGEAKARRHVGTAESSGRTRS
jgi:hypothetical protein